MQWKTGLGFCFVFFSFCSLVVFVCISPSLQPLRDANHKISIDRFDLKMINCSALVWNQKCLFQENQPQDPHVGPVHHSWHLCIVAFRRWIFHINRPTTVFPLGLLLVFGLKRWLACFHGMPEWANHQRPFHHPSLWPEPSENTSGLKLERANGLLARWTDQHRAEDTGEVACRCRMTSFREGGADKDKQHDGAVLPSWVSSSHLPSAQAHAAHASLKTAKRKTLSCLHWREGKLSSFLLNTKQRLSGGFQIWVWKKMMIFDPKYSHAR